MQRAPGDLPLLALRVSRCVPRPRLTFLMLIISQICFLAAQLMVILVKGLYPGSRRAPCSSECDQASIAVSSGE